MPNLLSCASVVAMAGSFCLLLAAPTTAQVIGGRVLAEATDSALAGAELMLLDTDDRVVVRTVSAGDGAFQMRAPAYAWYRLRAVRLGYESTTSELLDLAGSDRLEVEVRLAVEAVAMAPLTVVGRRERALDPRLERWDYYERQRSYGQLGAHFLDGDRLRSTATRLTDLLRDLPGLRVAAAGGRDVRVTDRRGCDYTFFLDGTLVRGGVDDAWVPPGSVVAIEVYPSGAIVPIQFVTPGRLPCGVVAVWTGIRSP